MNEAKCQGIERRFRKPEHMKKLIKMDSNRYVVEKFWNLWTLVKVLLDLKFSVRGVSVYRKFLLLSPPPPPPPAYKPPSL